MKHGAVKNEGNRKRRKAPAKAAKDTTKVEKTEAAAAGDKKRKPAKRKVVEETKEPAPSSLRDRLFAKGGSKDMEMAK